MEEDNLPLTKSKTKKSVKPVEIIQEEEEEEVVTPEPIKKTRKPKTEKQLQAFQKALEVRKNNLALKNEQKKIEASKYLLKKGIKLPKVEIEEEDDESIEDDEPEVIYVKKPPKKADKKKKKKKKIIIESDTEESESESEPEIVKKKSFGKKNF